MMLGQRRTWYCDRESQIHLYSQQKRVPSVTSDFDILLRDISRLEETFGRQKEN